MVKTEDIRKNQKVIFVLCIIIFSFFYVFFTRIEPMMVCDTDDWTYISYVRNPWPVVGAWNPAKIFPETIMGVIGDFSAFVIYPIIGDYLKSMTYTYAFVYCIVITIYVYELLSLLKRRFDLGNYDLIFCSICFMTMHFLLFKTNYEYNMYMLTATNLNCFYNYMLPALLCGIFVFHFFDKDIDSWYHNSTHLAKGFFVLYVLLMVFSNLVINIILISYLFADFIYKLFFELGGVSKVFDKKLRLHFMILAMDIVMMMFELTGGRQASEQL